MAVLCFLVADTSAHSETVGLYPTPDPFRSLPCIFPSDTVSLLGILSYVLPNSNPLAGQRQQTLSLAAMALARYTVGTHLMPEMSEFRARPLICSVVENKEG